MSDSENGFVNSKVDHYVDEYIMLCAQMCKKAEDYTKEKVAVHNKAVQKMHTLQENMRVDPQFAERVYSVLLNSDDAYVQQSAATACLFSNIHIRTAVKILKRIRRRGDRMSAMAAKRNLLIWKGKLSPDEPF